MRRLLILTLLCATPLAAAPPAFAAAGESDSPRSLQDRVENLQQDLDSLSEDIEDLREPVEEFEQFDECMYLIGVTEYGTMNRAFGYFFGQRGRTRRPALAIDIRGFSRPQYQFLAFPSEEPPSIECNEDAGQERIDD
jgi:hypothetical protein